MHYTRVLALFLLLAIPASTLSAAPRESRTKPSRIVQFLKRFVASIDSRITVPIGSPVAPPPSTSDAPLPETP